jgi:hypothetical protein
LYHAEILIEDENSQIEKPNKLNRLLPKMTENRGKSKEKAVSIVKEQQLGFMLRTDKYIEHMMQNEQPKYLT